MQESLDLESTQELDLVLASDPLVLVPNVCNHTPNICNRVEGCHTFPFSAITANAESYFVRAGEDAPSLITVANAVPRTPVIVSQSTGGYLSVPGGNIIHGDNTCHEDSSRSLKLNLLSVVTRLFCYIVRLMFSGDMNDGNFEGHNICKIVEIEHASISSTKRIGAELEPRVHRCLAEPVLL